MTKMDGDETMRTRSLPTLLFPLGEKARRCTEFMA